MNASRTGEGPGDDVAGSWATEALPLAVRRQLLERDLKRALSRMAGAPGAPVDAGPVMAPGDSTGAGTADHER